MQCSTPALLPAILSMQLFFSFAQSFSLPLVPPANQKSSTISQSTNFTTDTNLSFSPWPPRPFDIPIADSDYNLAIYLVTPYTSHPSISLSNLIAFIIAFSDNLEDKYPPPGYAPRSAWSTEIDLISYTRWRIESFEGFLGHQVLTSTVLAGLSKLLFLLRKHGPASIVGYLHLNGTSVRAFTDADIELKIETLADGGLFNESKASGVGSFFETS
ncbi:hypothetical protein ABVK25_012496 [Lepraria finkii]|uniref:Uncharacterized protein n=1 Tax=Lepraria finkii TaxID=1340010 RepID=A0ABR4AG67_9LECA